MPEAGFRPIAGQEEIKKNLASAARDGRPAHAYILEGDEGSGRRMLARAFANALVCERFAEEGREEPCFTCSSCLRFLSDNHPDVKVVTHEKQSISVEDIRKQIVNDVEIRPYSAPYKIYLVPEGEKMTPQAQNALLKTLEEPPSYVVILLMVTNSSLLLPTIRSRCLLLPVRPLPEETVQKVLEEYLERQEVPEGEEPVRLTKEEIRMIAAFSQGSCGRAIFLASSDRFRLQKQTALAIAAPERELTTNGMLSLLKPLESGDYLPVLELLELWFRDLLLLKSAGEAAEELLLFQDQDRELSREEEHYTLFGLEQVLRAIDRTKARLTANVRPENALEMLYFTIKENRI